MGILINGYKRVWKFVGMFSAEAKNTGTIKRATLGVIKGLDRATVPLRPNGTFLERIRIGIAESGRGGLSPNNIIHQVILVESEMFSPEQMASAYKILGQIVAKTKQKLRDEMSPNEKLSLVYKIIGEEGLKYKGQENQLFVSCLLAGNLDCDSSSFIALTVARELNWPVTLIQVSDHVFVRWQEADREINIDQGVILPNDYYLREFDVSELKPLNQNGIIALVFCTRFHYKYERGDIDGAMKDYAEYRRLSGRSMVTNGFCFERSEVL